MTARTARNAAQKRANSEELVGGEEAGDTSPRPHTVGSSDVTSSKRPRRSEAARGRKKPASDDDDYSDRQSRKKAVPPSSPHLSVTSFLSGSEKTGFTKKNKPRIPRKKATTLEEYVENGNGQSRPKIDYSAVSEERKRALDANRVAASRSRDKQRQKQQEFERQCELLDDHVNTLKVYKSALQDEIRDLFVYAEQHQGCGCSEVTKLWQEMHANPEATRREPTYY